MRFKGDWFQSHSRWPDLSKYDMLYPMLRKGSMRTGVCPNISMM